MAAWLFKLFFMRKLYLLLPLLCGTVTFFAQNKLPHSPHPSFSSRLASLTSATHHLQQRYSQTPFDLKARCTDSLYEQWRSHALVRDEEHPTKYLIIITLDGMRWQEVFMGADSALYTEAGLSARHILPASPENRRSQLLPFLWNEIASNGQIYGNRRKGSRVNVTNKMRISYPGYNEIFAGHPDDRHIKLNFKIPNPNPHVLRFIGRKKTFRGRVASFASWDVFPSIFNEKLGGMYVNAAFQSVRSGSFASLNAQLKTVVKPWGKRVRPDSLTTAFALQYLADKMPRVLHIGLGETDEYAHEKNYAQYLNAAQASDDMIREVWEFVQSSPVYRNKTTLFITTDHGRGNAADTWHKHHTWVEGADEIWFAVLGPETESLGEMENCPAYFQNQFARTFAGFLGLDYHSGQAVGNKIAALFGSDTRQITQR